MERLSDLRYRHTRAWAGLAQQPFLLAVRDGMVSLRAIRRWLAQDCFFVEGLMGFQAGLLHRAPQPHRLILAQGLVSTVRELDWLYLQDLDLSARPHPAVTQYLNYLRELEAQPYPLAAVLHWAFQRCFMDAWLAAKPEESFRGDSRAGGPLAELVEHWTLLEFQALLHDLGMIALEVEAEADPALLDQHLGRMLGYEKAMWQMAWEYAQE
ncbi:MAG TPA: hypothetical protein VFS50_00485 [Meiothermus sp.]|nr:hypothetical protein [Meiothermus sp.]